MKELNALQKLVTLEMSTEAEIEEMNIWEVQVNNSA